jgi:cell division septation protein DedD
MAGGSRRFEFGWLEVFGLILVFAGGSVVVFFLGVFVGKGLQENRIAREERVFRLAIDPIEEAARPAKPAPSGAASVPSPQATTAFALAVRPAPSPSAPAPSAAAMVAAPSPAPTEVRLAQAPSPAPSPSAALMGAGRGSWSVQVNATKDRSTARQIVEQLRGRGYNAYTVEVPVRGETWYRVRVGRFPTMGAATAMVVRLKSEERYNRAFLVEE